MASYTQANRRITISTPLGEDVLLLRALTGSETVSHLFQFDLDLLSENDSITLRDLVGKNVTTTITGADGTERHWNGFISRFSQGHRTKRFTSYHAEMVPWLWFLTRTADCRIFQKKKVPDIIKQIFDDLGFKDYEFRLYGDFAPREYCVQYRETDFDFVSRLMEEEGICYFFQHDKRKHVLILANDPAAHDPCPGQEKARYDSRNNIAYEDVITELRYEEEFRPGGWAHTDYNFETPSTSLAISVKGKNPYEIYDYPGEYGARGEGDRYARIRLQEQTAAGALVEGGGSCRYFTAGHKFTLEDHYRADLNQPYLLTSIRHTANLGTEYEPSSGADEEFTYQNTFQCIPFSIPFRPARVTPHPSVRGCQTAVVVGPAGEEIYTDKHGRVKVQFHWDREGKRDESSSCWVRVSHPWAGQGWGAISIPRIGQEVIVDFLEGDPDQPIIVGRVYNAEQMPPFGMPAGAVVSGVKSNSTKGGGGYNEISLNDTKGTELINIHAQYDQQKKVEHDERVDVGNDRTEHVGHNETITIDNNRTEKVGVNEDITIGSNRTEKVGSNEKISIGANRTETVGSNESITIGANRTENVAANETITIGANRTENVNANETVTVALLRTHNVGVNDMLNVGAANEVSVGGVQAITVGATRAVTVGSSQTITVGSSQTTSVGSDDALNVGGNQSTTVGGNESVNVGKAFSLVAADEITLKTGSASIVMKKDGTISIQGKDITVKGSGEIEVKASKNITMKGQKILQN